MKILGQEKSLLACSKIKCEGKNNILKTLLEVVSFSSTCVHPDDSSIILTLYLT